MTQIRILSARIKYRTVLCFGWIDGKLIRLDETRFVLRFSPRTTNSIWPISNMHRVQRLIGEGKMTDGGHKKIAEAQENGQWEAAKRRGRVDLIPDALEKALSGVSGGLDAYRAMPDPRKKQYIYWQQTAKREEIQQIRIRQIGDEVIKVQIQAESIAI